MRSGSGLAAAVIPWRGLALAALAALLAAHASARAEAAPAAKTPPAAEAARSPAAPTGPSGDRGEYRIGPEDILTINVWKNDALSLTVPVRPDGMISLPLLHDVSAAGMTPMELQDLLSLRLSEFVASPEVSVIVHEVHSPKVSIIGEVVHPGRYEIRSRTTVLDILAQAGGFTEFASRGRVVVLRSGSGKRTRIAFDYNKVTSDGRANVELLPGDVVIVP
jgi:polysaccharide export outer membrane protein